MSNEPRDTGSSYQRLRSSMHIGMGVLYIVLGGIAVALKYFGRFALDPAKAYLLGGLLIAYGLFRLWRGFRQLRDRNMPQGE